MERAACRRCDLEGDDFKKNEDLKIVLVYTRDEGRCIYRGNMCRYHRVMYETALNCSVRITPPAGFIKKKAG